MQRLRSILARVLIAGIIGAVATVGVAVGCAMIALPSGAVQGTSEFWKDHSTDGVLWIYNKKYAFGTMSGTCVALARGPGMLPPGRSIADGRCPIPEEAFRETTKGLPIRVVRIAGWPRTCVWGAIDSEPKFITGLPAGYVPHPPAAFRAISIGRSLEKDDPRGISGYLPIAPIWPGLAINTLFYGTIAWVLLFLPGTLRRWRRVRAGRCVKCGYERAGLAVGAACPECGGTTANGRAGEQE